jgi:hypothetical protein
MVKRASRLLSNDLPTQARRPRYIQKSKSKLLLVLHRRDACPPLQKSKRYRLLVLCANCIVPMSRAWTSEQGGGLIVVFPADQDF